MTRHFAERATRILNAHFLSFQRFADGEPVASFSVSVVKESGPR